MLDRRALAEQRKAGQALAANVHVGKAGVTDATVAELDRHLKKDKLVKVRLLPAAGDHGSEGEQALNLAAATESVLVEQRGHTALFYRP